MVTWTREQQQRQGECVKHRIRLEDKSLQDLLLNCTKAVQKTESRLSLQYFT